MKANLILDLDKIPKGIQVIPLTDDEKKLIQSLSRAQFNNPIVLHKTHQGTETKVSIQITISRSPF